MKMLSLLLTISSVLPVASAAELKNLSLPLPALIQQFSNEQLAEIPAPSPAVSLRTPAETTLYWSYLYKDTVAKGAAIFEYKKEQYAIKPMFRKGKYNIEKGTYVSAPWVYIFNITNIGKAAPLQAYLDPGDITDATITTTSGDKLK